MSTRMMFRVSVRAERRGLVAGVFCTDTVIAKDILEAIEIVQNKTIKMMEGEKLFVSDVEMLGAETVK